jgi:hypothetical protein
VYRDGVERGRGGSGHAAGRGADRARWAKSVCCAGDERGNDYTWNADACASADHVAAAVGSDAGSREYIAATVAFELDAAADGRSQSTQLGE